MIHHIQQKPNMAEPQTSDLERLLECPVCFKQFDDQRLLSCGHTFCLHCLIRTLGSNSTELLCPICREVTKIVKPSTINDLPKNLIISDLKRQISGLPDSALVERSRSRPCDLCTSDIPEKYFTVVIVENVSVINVRFSTIRHLLSRVT